MAASFRVTTTNEQLSHISRNGFWWGSPSQRAQVARLITRFRVRLHADTNGLPATNAIIDQSIDTKAQSTGQTMTSFSIETTKIVLK